MQTFNLKKEWFEKIKSGKKTHEYREVKDYWTKRFLKQISSLTSCLDGTNEIYSHRLIEFCSGYPKKDDKAKRILARIKVVRIINGNFSDLKINKPVFDIEFELINDFDIKKECDCYIECYKRKKND